VIYLDGQSFKTQKAAIDYVRDKVNAFDSDDPIWHELLSRHPERVAKMGPGIAGFKQQIHPLNKLPYMIVVRTDGSEIDFSWRTCVTGKAPSLDQRLHSAMREAVEDQIKAYRRDNPNAPCGICNHPNPAASGPSHVDHVIPFITLMFEFVTIYGSEPPKAFKDCPTTNRAIFDEKASNFSRDWQIFHADHAKLRISCRICNLSRQKGGQLFER
jgi:hypothetical protein